MSEASHIGPEVMSGQAPSSRLPEDILARVKREQEFFDAHSNPAVIPDEALHLDSAPEIFPAIEALLPQVKGKTVCDYGCGYGFSGTHFARAGALVHSFDVSENNVAIARRTAELNGVAASMQVRRMPGECLAFPDSFFDFVFGTAVLHHVDLTLGSRELYRVLKPGGTAVFAEPLGENKLLEWLRRSSWWEANHRHSPDEHSLCYREIEILESVFGSIKVHEIGLFSVVKPALRKVRIGMVAVPRWQRTIRFLEKMDDTVLRALPFLRPLAYYVELTMTKPAHKIAQLLQSAE